ncbi:hypothetical protein BGX38DRAFT_1140811 [Terfezia claveryi]|nr:hypothetical protein BGX38DRAFT_1140811 [Terfezia claveryi]
MVSSRLVTIIELCFIEYILQIPHQGYGEENTVSVEDFLELLEILLEGLDTQISDAARRERFKVLALQSNLEGKAKQFIVNLRPDKKTTYDAAARALWQRFSTQFNKVYWFPEVVDAYERPRNQVLQTQLPNQNKSRFGGSYLQRAQTQSARDQTPCTQNSVTYIELSDEDLGLVPEANPVGLITTTVSETPPAGMVNIADELVDPMEIDDIVRITHCADCPHQE